ncbi:Rne/Rng family ribonuclease [Amaricoccus macauensis]|uniref:Rne/Rng family ribonuclease n=1 Tax=Amaricoccus macauensis TaxID=57001 RepID=UPI003C7AB1C6
MTKKMLIDATHAEETRVVVLDGTKVDEFDFESLNKKQLAGNIYLAKVTRVEPSLQAAFVDYGGNRHGFLAFSEIHPDYYQIPKADREALLAEEAALAQEADEESERPAAEQKPSRSRSRSRKRSQPAGEGAPSSEDAILQSEPIGPQPDQEPNPGVESAEAGHSVSEQGDQSTNPSIEASGSPEGGTVATTDEMSAVEANDEPQAEPTEAAATEIEQNAPEASSDPVPAKAAVVEDVTAGATDTETEGAGEADSNESSANSDDASTAPQEDGSESMLVETPETRATPTDVDSVGGQENPRDEQPQRRARPRRYKIQEVIKVRQILLVQVIKEERGNKGAALTTYLSLAGRYCVLMPNTARGGGISRKITNATDRKKLKDISNSITVPEGAGLIIRTAGANRTKTEIRRDYEYLLRQWEQIRDLTLKSVAPCLIYEEGSLVKRAIRDLYSRDIDEVLVDGERGYREAKDYMKMLMPSHAKNVKHYGDPLPLFSRFQVESYLTGMFNPVVQLKSGGYIVIDVTEALVAIDVNSGRSTREASIEDTALRTNLEAAEEAARQMRLRDLAGLIVIDFIDMDERKNNSAVEKKLKEKLKSDRARIQVGRISSFGLLEMSRQRLRPGMIEATTKGCPHCHGTGRVRSDDSVALALLREVEEEGVRQRSKEVLVVAPVEIANYLLNHKREHVALIERRFGLSVRIEGDALLINPDYRIERFKTASRLIAAPEGLAPVKVEIEDMPEVEETEEEKPAASQDETETSEEKSPPKKKRRRRRRGGKSSREGSEDQQAESADNQAAEGEKPAEEADQKDEPSQTPENGSGDAAPAKVGQNTETTEGSQPAPSKPDAFGEVIDLGEAAPADIVAVPESESVQRPGRRPRVSQPAAAVIAEVAIAPTDEVVSDVQGSEADEPATADTLPAAEPEAEPDTPLVESVDDAEQGQPEPETLDVSPTGDAAETEPTAETVGDTASEAVETQASVSQIEEVQTVESELPIQSVLQAESGEPEMATPEPQQAPEPKRRGWWSRAGSAG